MAPAEAQTTTVPGSDGQRPADEELDLFGLTHRGRVREDNQDHFLIATVHPQVVVHGSSLPGVDELPLKGTRLGTLLVVADGVGGAAAGSDAARLATEAITNYVGSTLRCYHSVGTHSDSEFLDSLREAAFGAHDAVRAEAALRADHQRMASTLTVGFAVYPWFYVVQVGDSRAYYYWDGKLEQITRDQTVGQELVDRGVLPRERLDQSPLKNVLSSAIGADEAMPVVTRISIRNRGCVVLLCSDGLTRHVSDDEIADHLKNIQSAEQAARDLLKLALDRGGTDNITIVLGRAPLRERMPPPHFAEEQLKKAS
jgi:serine/threonine protein phosphatase PrpC